MLIRSRPKRMGLGLAVVRLTGLLVFAYDAALAVGGAFSLMTPRHTVRGTYGPYPIAAVASLGLGLAGLAFAIWWMKGRTAISAFDRLLVGVAALIAMWVVAFLLVFPIPTQ
ncbi:MAG: hypothetical protein HY262_08915 [Chloroflexi bacterium]|nr:hypothetical protein [Chloroflexota bacterium]